MSAAHEPLVTAADWRQRKERGSALLLRWMSRLSLRCGRRATRPLLHLIVLYFMACSPAARRHSLDFLRRALGRPPRLRDRYLHLLSFATTIHDRVFLVNGRLEEFSIEVEGAEHLQHGLATGSGALLMGAHLGSFEVLSAVGQLRAGVTVAMAMYEENARKVNAMLAALNPATRTQVIALGRMDAMLRLRDLLDAGTFVGVLADRTLGAEPTRSVQLLGSAAQLPTGPMRAAALLRRRVIFMAGVYRGGNRYRVEFGALADFTQVDPAAREAAIAAAIDGYALRLDALCRSDPYNWFNFFDFWRSGPAPG